jgi:serine/threonine protein kinase
MSRNFLGIFYNLDELGSAYGLAAYKLLFDSVDPDLFRECTFSDGDVVAKLPTGNVECYCIGIQSVDPNMLLKIETEIAQADVKGFAPLDSRFGFDPRINDHLALAGLTTSDGNLQDADGWLRIAWEQRRTTNRQIPAHKRESQDLVPTILDSNQPPEWLRNASKAKSGADEYLRGEVIGKDYLVRDIRKGGMGVVYIVEDLKSRRENISLRLALKTFQSRYLWNEEAISRFEREAVVWVKLGKHPNIVHAMLVQRIANQPYLWLEFVEGRSLAEHLSTTRLTVSEVIDYALQFCRGMRYAFEYHALIHRDIKPANILIDGEHTLKITDFGLSKLQAELAEEHCLREGSLHAPDEMETVSAVFVTAAGRCMGTPAYIAPEAILGSAVDTRADIYSFGVVLYEMLAGRRPFNGPDILEQHLSAQPVPLCELDLSVPMDLEQIVSRCLLKEREERFQTFAELEAALAQINEKSVDSARAREADSVPLSGQWFMKGFTFMEFGRYEEAIDCFREVLALEPSQEEALNNIGVCLGNLGQYEEAGRAFNDAITKKPKYPEAWANLGGVYERLRQYEAGKAACERAIELKPDWAEAHANLGLNLLGLGRVGEATSSFKRAIDEDASYWKAYLQLARIYADGGSQPEAVAILQKALQLDAREPDLLVAMAACLCDLQQIQEASRYLQLALQVDPNHPLAAHVRQFLERETTVE